MTHRIARPDTAFSGSIKAKPKKDGAIIEGPMPQSKNFIDLTGARFGMVTVEKYIGKQQLKSYWQYRCDCGNIGRTASGNLAHKVSCGCAHRERLSKAQTSHGETVRGRVTVEYGTWEKMIRRCHDPRDKAFKWYGARGIKVCDSWRNDVLVFIADMGRRPSPKHSIDRIDNDGDYRPDNCRWATSSQQNSNRSSNHNVRINGERMTLDKACKMAGFPDVVVHARLGRGWTLKNSLTRPSAKTLKGGFPLTYTIEDERDGL